MNEKVSHRKRLEEIYISPSFAPILQKNPKYCVDQFAEFTPYISFKDVLNSKFLIRGCPIGSGNAVDDGNRDVIIEYSSIDELLDDGWRLE